MERFSRDTTDLAPRRGFFARMAGMMALGLAGSVPGAVRAEPAASPDDGPDWPGQLKGRHRQVVDGYEINGGMPLVFVHTFLATNKSASGVLILRYKALPLALRDEMWAKYKIGESFKIIDPETKAPAVKNPYFKPKPGVMNVDDAALGRLVERGTVVGACNIALHGLSKRLAPNAGVTADEAAKEWAANVVPGATVIPSGTWGVNRAQEAGCTYCTGG